MKLGSVEFRNEQAEDIAAIREILVQAFDGNLEADLVNALREAEALTLSMVAINNDKMIGHILFSPGTIENDDSSKPAVALGPVAVLPEHQRLGVGSALIARGLEECRKRGYSVAFLVGHPEYYPRFGFVPGSTKGITCIFADGNAFMVAELRTGGLKGVHDNAIYRPEFDRF